MLLAPEFRKLIVFKATDTQITTGIQGGNAVPDPRHAFTGATL